MIKNETVAKAGLDPTPAFGHPSDGVGLKEFRDKSLCSPPGRGTRSGGWDQRRADAAFTLIEVVVAAVLMLLSMGLLLSTFVSASRSAKLAQTHFTAMQIACSETERLQTNLYANINGASSITLTNSLIECRMSRSVTTNTLNEYKDVAIIIEWTAPASSRRQALTNYMTICNTN